MTWLSVAEAVKRGIDVAMLGPPSPASTTRPAVGTTDLEHRASNFVGSLFASRFSPNAQALQALEGLYEDTVTYYGKVISREAVLNDKRRFVERWPQRFYTVRPGTLIVQCDDGSLRCTVSGTTEWAAAKDAKRSTGAANFYYAVLMGAGGLVKIAEETSKVVQGPIISAHVPGNPPWATNETPCTRACPQLGDIFTRMDQNQMRNAVL
jgi:hypothetical protein